MWVTPLVKKKYDNLYKQNISLELVYSTVYNNENPTTIKYYEIK